MFKTNVKGTNTEITPEISAYLEKRITAFKKFLDADDPTVLFEIELERSTHHKSGNVFRAEITLHVAGDIFRSEAMGETMQAAIDGVKKQVLRELRVQKRKKLRLFRRGGAKMKEMAHKVSDFWPRRKK